MPNRSSDPRAATEVHCHSTAVAQRELNFPLTLLACHTSCDGAVDLVCQPVLTSYTLLLEHGIKVFLSACRLILQGGIALVNVLVHHIGLGRGAEHIRQSQVNGLVSPCLFEGQVHILRGASYDIHRSTLTLGDACDALYIFALDEQAHTLLALVADDLLGGKGLVPDGEGAEVKVSACRLHELGEAIEVTACSVVVDGDDGIVFALGERTDDVLDTLLHLGVGALDGIELDRTSILPCVHRADGTPTHTDAVVVPTEEDDFFARLGSTLLRITAAGIAHATSEHNDLVEAVGRCGVLPFVLEGQHRTADEWLTELVPEVARPIRSLRQDLARSLVEPRTSSTVLLCRAICCGARVAGHIDGRPSQGDTGTSASHTVTDLPTRTCGSPVEGLYGRGEVMRLCLEAQHAVDGLADEEVRLITRGRSELLQILWPIDEGYIILVGGDQVIGVGSAGILDHREEATLFLLTIEDEGATEDLMTAVLAIDLREAEEFAVCQGTPQTLAELLKVGNLLLAQSQSLRLIVGT